VSRDRKTEPSRKTSARGGAPSLALGGALLLFSAHVGAQEDAKESLLLSYDAPKSCADRTSFEEITRGLTETAQFSAPSAENSESASRRLKISITERSADFSGSLVLVDGDTSARRQFDAETCQEVVEALALATALAIDPDALGATPPPPPPKKKKAPPDSPVKAPVEPPSHHLVLGVAGELFALHVEEPGEAGTRLRANSGASAYASWEFRMGQTWSSLDASLGYSWSKLAEVDLRWSPVGRIVACPVWWSAQEPFRVAPCLGASLAGLRSSPQDDVAGAQEATRTWFSLELAARAQLVLGSLRMSLTAGATLPTSERTYALAGTASNDAVLLSISPRPAPFVGLQLGGSPF